ncbi:flagellar export chaperone FlgN [Vibrio sp. S4M6]|uniref:flagella synthesis protein FlgN n=1 Tax=Vibrio sinus TaxID=2946865 RepID=UPI00202A60AF|nr:flagellar export chaperone FlgN [Vibrio sinus]MCL9783912.1 flagellar export chaperone FlgN [Vibrio sinus]
MAALDSLLEFQLKNANDLSALLEKEKVAIATRIAKDIENLANKKLELISQLNTTDQRIGSHPDISEQKDNADISSKIDQIRSIIHDCQQANLVNGEALKRAQLSFNKLNNLMQQSQGKIGMTYDSGGQAQTISTLGTNIKA